MRTDHMLKVRHAYLLVLWLQSNSSNMIEIEERNANVVDYCVQLAHRHLVLFFDTCQLLDFSFEQNSFLATFKATSDQDSYLK